VALASGERAVAAWSPVQGTDWVVGISDARAGAEAPLAAAARRIAWGAALLALGVGALAWWFARGVVQPLHDLTRAADALKAGDFHNATVPVQRRDDLGALARSFNVMIDVLRQRERERERRP
jgi:HAMP domain-containing protein